MFFKKPEINKTTVRKFAVDLIFIVTGCCLGAFATIAVLIPNGLSSGGITGISRIIQNQFEIQFSLIYYALALIILLACIIFLGWKEASKILLLTIIFPSSLWLFEQFEFNLLEQKDTILAAIYCGILSGIGSGLVFSRGYSFGGTDTVAKIIKYRLAPQMSLSKILLVIDAVVIIASGIFFGRNIALYALVTQVIFSRVVEYVMYGFDTKVVQLEVITEQHDLVSNYIMYNIGRGVSNVRIIGEYTRLPRDKIITLCSPRESMLIRQFVAKTDPHAFVTVMRIEAVWGRGDGFGDLQDQRPQN
ncbi:MAG TPA: YitT family protein [Clostridiales bacterium]|jgi:uncharacterized membrane-anchored protein YitT (DUF2179 family)|nr:YitT family protein [Clostridiales bacterium]